MNITTPMKGMQNELAEEVRQYGDLDGATIRHEIETLNEISQHTVTVTLNGREAVGRCSGAVSIMDAREQKRIDKHAAKRACYLALCDLTDKTQPWGSLTGVRPTALLRSLIQKGKEDDFTGFYDVHPHKYQLAKHIIDVQDALMKKVDRDAVCVYIGIPFCISRCSYCSFPGRIAKKGEMETYVDALIREMDAVGQAIRAHEFPIASIYIGGGTPTSLPTQLLEKLLRHMQSCFGAVEEITLEAGRPDTLNADKLSAAKRFGVTRICINPQTMVDQTLKRIGRLHTAKDVEQAIELARSLEFSHINMDIIAGLPGETEKDFEYTLSCLRDMAPSALTCHTLSLKHGSKLLLQQHTLCDTDVVSNMVEQARSCAHSMGMEPYYMYRQKYMAGNLENVGYAKIGNACLYNVAMMDEMLPVMGLGVGAMGKYMVGDLIVRKPNPRDIFVYQKRLESILDQKRDFYGVDKKNTAVYNMQNGNDEDR